MLSKIPVHINPYDCAKRGVVFKGSIKVNQFKRLLDLINESVDGPSFEMELLFDVDQAGDSKLSGFIKGNVVLDCQRCLHGVAHEFLINLNHVLCPNVSSLDRHKSSDTILADEEEKVRVVDLIEDEILLELPSIPKHLKVENCTGLDHYLSGADEKIEKLENISNPFSMLKDKLKL